MHSLETHRCGAGFLFWFPCSSAVVWSASCDICCEQRALEKNCGLGYFSFLVLRGRISTQLIHLQFPQSKVIWDSGQAAASLFSSDSLRTCFRGNPLHTRMQRKVPIKEFEILIPPPRQNTYINPMRTGRENFMELAIQSWRPVYEPQFTFGLKVSKWTLPQTAMLSGIVGRLCLKGPGLIY